MKRSHHTYVGARKTDEAIRSHFFWPKIAKLGGRLIPRLMDIFSKFGVAKVIQSDRGSSSSMGKLFQLTLRSKMGTSTAHQRYLEHFHKTLMQIL